MCFLVSAQKKNIKLKCAAQQSSAQVNAKQLQHMNANSNEASAVHQLLAVSLETSSGIVSLDATGLASDTRNTHSSYPPAYKRSNGSDYYDEDPREVRGSSGVGRPVASSLTEQSVALDISLLRGAALETPAALDPATAQHMQHNQHNQVFSQSNFNDVLDRRAEDAVNRGSRNSNTSNESRDIVRESPRRSASRGPSRELSRGSHGSRGSHNSHRSHRSRGSHNSRLDSPGMPLGFMSGGTAGGSTAQNFSRKRVAIGRKRCYISNIASFEAFSTTEAEVDVRRAVDNLMTTVRNDQLQLGGPTRKGEMWKTIEAFFDAIPFVGLEGGEMGAQQFTQYIRCMSSLRDGIRAAMYDDYNPDVDHRTLVPNFSALDLARETIQTLEAGLKEAEKAVVNSVVATKTDVVNAFKKLKPKDREDLRVYLEKREDFKPPKTPKIGEYRKYSENKRKGIPRSMMGHNGGAAAKWLLGGGGILSKLKSGRLESKMQSQHIEIRRIEGELRDAQRRIAELQTGAQSQGKHKLMDELCVVLGIEDVDNVHADDIIGRVTRMRRRNIDGALSLFEQQGTNPEYKEHMKKLVELLDITTFESGSVEEEIVLAVETLIRRVKESGDGDDEVGADGSSSGRQAGGGHGNKSKKKYKLKSIGAMIKRMNATEKTMVRAREVAARKVKLQQKKGAQKASKKEVRKFMKGQGSVSNDVSLCSLLSGLTVVSGKQVPSGINVNNTLAAIYEAKIVADIRADATHKQRLSLAQYLRTFLVHQYGVKKLAMKQMLGMIKAIKKHRTSVPRLNLFARLVGMEEKDEDDYSSLAADYFLVVLVELFRSLSIKKITDQDDLDVSGMMRDGITKKRLLTNSEISSALQHVDMGRGDRQRVMVKIQHGKSWDVDQFLTQVMDCWYESHHERLMKTEQVFFDSDENGDGELTLDEFTVAVRVMEPHCPEEDVIELYDRIAGDDGVIDAEEFAQGVTLLHSHMIKHQRRIREERRNQQIKDAVLRKQAMLQYKAGDGGILTTAETSDAGAALLAMQPHPPVETKPVGERPTNPGLSLGF